MMHKLHLAGHFQSTTLCFSEDFYDDSEKFIDANGGQGNLLTNLEKESGQIQFRH